MEEGLRSGKCDGADQGHNKVKGKSKSNKGIRE